MQNTLEKRILSGPDLEYRLEQSRKATEGKALRTIRCPGCGFYLLDVEDYEHYIVRVKCRKCKFNDVIDTAFFRTMKKKQLNRLKKYSEELGKVRYER